MASAKVRKEAADKKLTPIEEQVGQALLDLETGTSEIKAELRELYILSAREIEGAKGKTSILIVVPYRLLAKFHKIQTRLVRELEKKFSGKPCLFIAQRRIISRERKGKRLHIQKRPMSRTLTSVHEKILEDLVFPTEIVGKRMRYKVDGSRVLRVLLDPKEQSNAEYKADTFQSVYKKLTGKDVAFEFPVMKEE